MNNVGRVVATFFVWAGIAVMVGITSTYGKMDSSDLAIVIPILVIAATIATRFVWQEQRVGMQAGPTFAVAEKSKRSSHNRLNQLINTMSEDEAADMLAEMRARILSQGGSDGELPLEALLGERERRGGTQRN